MVIVLRSILFLEHHSEWKLEMILIYRYDYQVGSPDCRIKPLPHNIRKTLIVTHVCKNTQIPYNTFILVLYILPQPSQNKTSSPRQ